MRDNLSNISHRTKVAAGAVLTVAVCAVLWRISAYHIGTNLVRTVRWNIPWMVVIFGPVLLAGIGLIVFFTGRDMARQQPVDDLLDRVAYRYDSERRGKSNWDEVTDDEYDAYVAAHEAEVAKAAPHKVGRGIMAGAVVMMLVATFWFVQGVRWLNRLNFERHEHYAAELVDTTEAHPGYDTRLSIPQARLLFKQLTGIQGTISDPTYIGNQDGNPEYCAVAIRGGGLNRKWTREVICIDPATGRDRRAELDHVGTPGGGWSSKLGDQVASVHRGLVFNDEDVYGYITPAGKARLIVPVYRHEGRLLEPYNVAAGVIEFTDTGERIWHEELTAGEIPGPVLPIAIAEQVRGSVNTLNGFLPYKKLSRSTRSLEATNVADGVGATDPNAENPTEFTLVRDGRLVYVTPLTPVGQSQTIVAYLEVYADEVANGTMPAATLYRLPTPEASFQLITQRVTTLYDADIDWMDTNEATDASNRARIYEITPTTAGNVTLTIGTGAQSLYRVYVESALNENNSFGQICIHRFRDDTKLRCDSADADPAPVGALRGLAGNSQSSGNTGSSNSGQTDLSSVPTEELVAELARRYPTATGS